MDSREKSSPVKVETISAKFLCSEIWFPILVWDTRTHEVSCRLFQTCFSN